ncbi:MAG: cytochrome C [Ignavibacteria bacterium]|nr:cytochrome C [Ignavibacteria bacterium]
MENFWLIVSKPDNVPIIILLLTVVGYTWYSFSKMRRNDQQEITEEAKLSDKIQVWPNLVKVEFITTIVIMVLLMFWSIFIDAPLEEPANPTLTPNPSKAPWYFLGLQEMLVYFDPWIAGVILPTLIIIGLIVIPYIDNNEKGNGYYTFKERKFAIIIFNFGFIILWVALIILGTFLRGPGWNFFWPWEYWDTHLVVALTNIDLSEVFGIHTYDADGNLSLAATAFGAIVVHGYFFLGVMYYRWKKHTEVIQNLGLLRYSILAFLFLSMMALPIKMILRLSLNIKYVWVTPWFNI